MSVLDDIEIQMSRMDIAVVKDNYEKGNPMFVRRIIHPVGQGAFYSERIRHRNGCLNVVYDCGSNTSHKVNGKKKIIQTEIESYYDEKEIIDLLFISHFDSDHVNGLVYLKKHCCIKRVVMPLIPTSAKCFYLSQLDENLQQLITNPQAFFGEGAEITHVRCVTKEEPHTDSWVLRGVEPGHCKEIESGTHIMFGDLHDWCYIPFNFDEEARYSNLINELQIRGLNKDELLRGDVDYITNNRTAINNAYKNIVKKKGTSNDSSLVVYSGPCATPHSYRRHSILTGNNYRRHILAEKSVGCLYLGDVNLNQTSNGMDLCTALSMHLTNVKEHIGLIQVPHHGSKNNFNDDILFLCNGYQLYFASFKTQNHYGHPSYKVVEDIMQSNDFVGVSEDRDSVLIDIIKGVDC